MTLQEFIDKHYAALDLSVIDAAIELARSGRQVFSCTALTLAVYNAARRYIIGACTDAAYPVTVLYREQYEESVRGRNAGCLPRFWNGADTPANRAARVKALQDFRTDCVAAANKEQA